MTSPWLTPESLSERLGGIPLETLKYWRKKNRGPRWAKFGHYIRYHIDHVEAWEQDQVRESA